MSRGSMLSACSGATDVPLVHRAPWWAPPLLAVQFLTRLPVPPLARLSGPQAEDGLARAMAWLPPVGTVIGTITASVFVLASLVWSPIIAALLALAVEALITGFFHEDAVADFCDAFGGTARGETALRIMRDSRIGSYGTVGLMLAVGLRLAAMVALPMPMAAVAIVAAATVGRLWAVLLATLLPPARLDGVAAGMGRAVPVSRAAAAILLAIPGIVPLMIVQSAPLLGSTVTCLLFLWWIKGFLRQRIGGSTGDCLGFAAYMGQLSVLLCAAVR
jgi:adenosylcobinamide-GDP ribazoletransferase